MHVGVDLTCAPSGNLTIRGLIAGCTLDVWASVTKKVLVAPESNIAHSLMFSMLISTVDRRGFALYSYGNCSLVSFPNFSIRGVLARLLSRNLYAFVG